MHFLLEIDPSEGTDQAPYSSKEFIESFHATVFGAGLRGMLGYFKSIAPNAAYVDSCIRARECIEYYRKQALEKPFLQQEALGTHEPQKQRSMVNDDLFRYMNDKQPLTPKHS